MTKNNRDLNIAWVTKCNNERWLNIKEDNIIIDIWVTVERATTFFKSNSLITQVHTTHKEYKEEVNNINKETLNSTTPIE